LGCSVSELLGIDSQGRFKGEKKGDESRYSGTMLYGTVSIVFGRGTNDEKEWPISEGQRLWVLDQLGSRTGFGGESPDAGWIHFETLDDRLVFVNSAVVEHIGLVSDDAEAAPSYEHEEVYRTIRKLVYADRPTDEELERDDAPFSKQLLERCEALVEEWGGEDAALDYLEHVKIERLDGDAEYFRIEEEGISQLAIRLIDNQEGNPTDCFVDLYSEGWHRSTYFRYGALRLIEISLTRWNEFLGEDESDTETEDKL
jgi:hypothetical protein